MKEIINSYLDSLEKFNNELQKRNFTDEEKRIIFRIFSEFSLNMFKSTPESVPLNQGISSSKSIDIAKMISGYNFAELVRKTKLKQHNDLVLLAAYYLVLVKGLESFTVTEIENEYSSAMLKISTNTHAYINVNRRKGYIMEAGKKEGKMAFKITMSGIDYIENILKNE